MLKPHDIEARIAAGKSVLPLTWRERFAFLGAGVYVVIIGIPVVLFVVYCVVVLLLRAIGLA